MFVAPNNGHNKKMVSFNLMPTVTRKTEIENSQQKLQAFCDATGSKLEAPRSL